MNHPDPAQSATARAGFPARLHTRLARAVLNRYAVFLACLVAYSGGMKLLGGLGGVSLILAYVEVALVLYLYWYFNRILRPSRFQAVLAAVPIILAYLAQDIYYLMYGRVFRIIEIAEVPELLDILTPTLVVAVLIVFVLPLAAFLSTIDYRRVTVIVAGAVPLLALVAAAEFFPKSYASAFEKVGNEIVTWSDEVSVENNGRLAMLLYREAQRINAIEMTEPFRDRPAYDARARAFADQLSGRRVNRNVHLIVMESLLDPTLFRAAKFTGDPVHPDFARLFGAALGFSQSPVFGGATSQAEFEVLCGVPAFRELGSVEFNAFTGAPGWCLPGVLHLAGYRTIASNAYKPDFFNAIPAYRGAGFSEVYFPREYSAGADTYLSAASVVDPEKFMFDGALFAQNLDFVSRALQDPQGPPLFNYVMTIYGHMPHVMTDPARPLLFKLVSDHYDEQLERAANQYYYRTREIAAYVTKLTEIDPDSLIVVVSDHVPPLQFGPNTYRDLRYLEGENSYYLNRVLIIENGRPRRYPTIHHYDIPDVVLNYLTAGAHCRERACEFTGDRFTDTRERYRTQYMALMAHVTE